MAIIKRNCPTCNKPSDIIKEDKYPTFIIMTMKCGHSLVDTVVQSANQLEISSYKSLDNYQLFNYQQTGVKFVFSSNGRCLIADEMGLGKTVQGLAPVALRKKDFSPALVACKSVAKGNWMKHAIYWGKCFSQVISSAKDVWHGAESGIMIHIVSQDMLATIWNEAKLNPEKHKGFLAVMKALKLLIIDESHLLKNPETIRARAIKELSRDVKHIIGLSGTPIKNNAREYFTILNILHPEKFFNESKFCDQYVEMVWDGYGFKYGGLKNPELFKAKTEDFIIRRTMDEVFPDMPKLFRHPTFVELENEVAEIYDAQQAAFAEYFDSNKEDADFQSNILAKMAQLRHITSLAKIDLCIDTVMNFLGNNNRKLAIFTHHLDSRDILAERLTRTMLELNLELPWVLASLGTKDPSEYIEDFKNSNARVIILSTLSHGESLNLQFISDSILHERQWNPANEDQAISGRFRRVGSTAERINCNILVAIGTIDEYFAELVERKRIYFDSTMNGKKSEVQWNETSLMMELAELIAEKGRKKWTLV